MIRNSVVFAFICSGISMYFGHPFLALACIVAGIGIAYEWNKIKNRVEQEDDECYCED